MPSYIIHKDGAYNVYNTVSDGCRYIPALTLDQICEELEIPRNSDRLSRAHANGCSGIGWTLDDCIAGNRAGDKEAELPPDEFIRRFLTLPQLCPRKEQGVIDLEALVPLPEYSRQFHPRWPGDPGGYDDAQMTAFRQQVAREVAKRCAEICAGMWRIDGQSTADEFANEIRAEFGLEKP